MHRQRDFPQRVLEAYTMPAKVAKDPGRGRRRRPRSSWRRRICSLQAERWVSMLNLWILYTYSTEIKPKKKISLDFPKKEGGRNFPRCSLRRRAPGSGTKSRAWKGLPPSETAPRHQGGL